jgi:cytochrome c
VLPAADVKAGEAVFAKCKSCHTIEAGGPNGTGPNLHGTLGKKPGTHPGFAYSQAMIEHGNKVGVWGYEEISEFLTAPQKHVSGTKMTFVGLKKPEDRIAVIAYLHSEGSTLPFPAPNPAAAAAPAEGAAAAPAAEGAAPAAPAAEGAAAPAAAAPAAK